MQKINGKEYILDNVSLVDFLRQNNYDISRIAIELNGKILSKDKYQVTLFCDGDKIEIVSFVGGG